MGSEATTQVLDTISQDPAANQFDLKRKRGAPAKTGLNDHDSAEENQESSSDWTKDFDMTSYDLQAHTLLCAEILNGEGIDRLPNESDSDLAARLWANWAECKFFVFQKLICEDQRSWASIPYPCRLCNIFPFAS